MISVPSKFIAKLDEKLHDGYKADIHKLIYGYGNILEYNSMEFFPEYTDHGINHINDLLASCENIIDENSYAQLSHLDICILIYSVILHDMGMHLTSKIFENLINRDEIAIPEIDTFSWKYLWDKYLIDSRKFSSEQKYKLFGNKDIIVNEPNLSNLSDIDKRLIGEFIRMYHPRIAHEISLNIISFENYKLHDFIKFDAGINDLSGLISRSHGMNIRDTFSYLQLKFQSSWKTPYNVKSIYLMAVLRIADYIQVQKERASEIILNTKRFSSKYSNLEWNLHNSINFIGTSNDDPEQIYIQAAPENAELFIKLKRLLAGIQNEMDVTWAALGETYGNTPFSSLKLKYRRIKSNIDNVVDFSKSVNYLPREIKFKADPSVLKLLIKPLYNNNPSLGIRELIQNSVDACLELKTINHQKGTVYTPEISIKLIIEKSDLFLVITDNGVGMNEDILVNYYFEAGVSFRNSKEWLSLFSNSGLTSKVERTGRFGVGALSSFLLGEEIIVRTRRYNEKYTLEFSANIVDENIEIKKTLTNLLGTQITIKLTDEVKNIIYDSISSTKEGKLDWFTWYYKSVPQIDLNIDPSLSSAFLPLPNIDNILPDTDMHTLGWRSFSDNFFTKTYWTFETPKYNTKKTVHRLGSLFCNGFPINNGFQIQHHKYFWILPTVSIQDNNGTLPLSLDRNSIYNQCIPNERNILLAIAKDLVSAVLSVEFETIGGLHHLSKNSLFIDYKCRLPLIHNIICKNTGYTINNFSILRELNVKKIWSFWLTESCSLNYNDIFEEDHLYNIYRINEKLNHDIKSFAAAHHTYLDEKKYWFSPFNNIDTLKTGGDTKTIFVSKKIIESSSMSSDDEIIDPFIKYQIKSLASKSFENLLSEIPDKIKNETLLDECFSAIAISTFNLKNSPFEFSILGEMLHRYLHPDYIIPFDFEERKKKYPVAFNDLSETIDKYRKSFSIT